MVKNKHTSDRQTRKLEGEIVHELRIEDSGVLDSSSKLSKVRVVIVVQKLFVLAVGAIGERPITYREVGLKLKKNNQAGTTDENEVQRETNKSTALDLLLMLGVQVDRDEVGGA